MKTALRRPRIMEDNGAEGAMAEPQPDTLAALLTASLSAKLAAAVSELVGSAYAARVVRIEPKAHGGAEILVEFLPYPPDHTLKIASGEDTVELPLPPGVVDEPTS
jgi:hypothetical protein